MPGNQTGVSIWITCSEERVDVAGRGLSGQDDMHRLSIQFQPKIAINSPLTGLLG
jgi:hypothetical protein